MVTVYDVPAEKLILKVSEKLKENDKIVPPEWAEFAKTGIHTERAPVQQGWGPTRAACIKTKMEVERAMGTTTLAGEYGGFNDRGCKPNKAVKGSRNIVRKCLIQLQDAGLLEATQDKQGRKISPAGQKLLDNSAKEVFDESKN